MTTFQAILQAIVHCVFELLPIGGAMTGVQLLSHALSWQAPSECFEGVLLFVGAFALFFYFRHDWASIISNLLRVLVYRKFPSSLDERLSLFITMSAIPPLLAHTYLQPFIPEFLKTPLGTAIMILLGALPLWFGQRFSRKNRGMFDWNPLDAFLIGVGQAFYIFPGMGRQTGALVFGLFRNYNLESLMKYIFLAATPLMAGRAFAKLHGFEFLSSEPVENMSWLSVGAAGVVSFASYLLLLGAISKQAQAKEDSRGILIRVLLGISAAAWFWFKS